MRVPALRPSGLRAVFAATLLAATAAPAANAHDVWFEPTTFSPKVGERVGLALRVGMAHAGEAMPRFAPRIVRFFAVGPDGKSIDVPGVEGMDPAGVFAPSVPGPWVVAYRSNNASIELEPEKFEKYLADEGLTGPSAERAKRGERAKPGRELYSRSVKAILAVPGSDAAGTVTKPLGITLEFVPEKDPSTIAVGGTLGLVLLRDGKPLSDVQFEAFPKSSPATMQRGRTDKAGRFEVELGAAGPWLVKAVQMTRVEGSPNADWESVWTSLVFEVR
jgi:uncharacterized GH25 family protein